MNDLFLFFTGRELSDDEQYSTYYNEYNELCYAVYNTRTGEIVERNAF